MFITTSSYPNRETFQHQQEFCLVTKRLVNKCKGHKRPALEAKYPALCGVLQPLAHLRYRVQRSQTAVINMFLFSSEEFICAEKVSGNLSDQVYQYAKDNLVLFNTFIKDPYVKKFLRDEKITWISYIANAGGLLGLCMGFSLVSGAEIVYHFLLEIFSLGRRGELHTPHSEPESEPETQTQTQTSRQLTYHPFLASGIDYESPETDSFSYQTGKFITRTARIISVM